MGSSLPEFRTSTRLKCLEGTFGRCSLGCCAADSGVDELGACAPWRNAVTFILCFYLPPFKLHNVVFVELRLTGQKLQSCGVGQLAVENEGA